MVEGIPNPQLLDMYAKMVLIRHFENTVAELFGIGKIPGFVHVSVGEEAVAVGVCANLRKGDCIATTHRGHGHVIAKGGDLRRMFAELYGKKTGYCKGKGGSMHIADFSIGVLGACGIVGGGIPHATGAALAFKVKSLDNVAVAFFGDGATNQGVFHESLNLASIWKLPLVYVCENNLYAISVRASYHMNISDISARASAYAMPGVTVDGNDVFSVYKAMSEAATRARAGLGPTLLECKTYRWRGHWEGDPDNYRNPEEILAWKEKCPIKRFKTRLIEAQVLTEDEAQRIEDDAESQVAEAVRFAEESPWPRGVEALEDLFATAY